MSDRTDPAARAEAARAREAEARTKSSKNTLLFGLALFGIVFSLLSFKYITGSDPSLQRDSISAQQEFAPTDDDDDDDWIQPQRPSQGQTAPPTSRAS